mmetsp:Transcript_65831/g.152969  ORF Transcript_65831/g.152969 Transcript_65831/m.152969 type:complete len:252 (-) Transcript_65831:317-1072(-)
MLLAVAQHRQHRPVATQAQHSPSEFQRASHSKARPQREVLDARLVAEVGAHVVMACNAEPHVPGFFQHRPHGGAVSNGVGATAGLRSPVPRALPAETVARVQRHVREHHGSLSLLPRSEQTPPQPCQLHLTHLTVWWLLQAPGHFSTSIAIQCQQCPCWATVLTGNLALPCKVVSKLSHRCPLACSTEGPRPLRVMIAQQVAQGLVREHGLRGGQDLDRCCVAIGIAVIHLVAKQHQGLCAQFLRMLRGAP